VGGCVGGCVAAAAAVPLTLVVGTGALAEWFATHPEYLPLAQARLLASVSDPALAAAAVSALRDLCTEAAPALVPALPALFQAHLALAQGAVRDRCVLAEALASVVSAAPADVVGTYLAQLLRPSLATVDNVTSRLDAQHNAPEVRPHAHREADRQTHTQRGRGGEEHWPTHARASMCACSHKQTDLHTHLIQCVWDGFQGLRAVRVALFNELRVLATALQFVRLRRAEAPAAATDGVVLVAVWEMVSQGAGRWAHDEPVLAVRYRPPTHSCMDTYTHLRAAYACNDNVCTCLGLCAWMDEALSGGAGQAWCTVMDRLVRAASTAVRACVPAMASWLAQLVLARPAAPALKTCEEMAVQYGADAAAPLAELLWAACAGALPLLPGRTGHAAPDVAVALFSLVERATRVSAAALLALPAESIQPVLDAALAGTAAPERPVALAALRLLVRAPLSTHKRAHLYLYAVLMVHACMALPRAGSDRRHADARRCAAAGPVDAVLAGHGAHDRRGNVCVGSPKRMHWWPLSRAVGSPRPSVCVCVCVCNRPSGVHYHGLCCPSCRSCCSVCIVPSPRRPRRPCAPCSPRSVAHEHV
jgi:hypothetical protein